MSRPSPTSQVRLRPPCTRALGSVSDVAGGALRRLTGVPRLSEFYGIVIYMYFQDHNPPHFHAIYAEYEALIQVDSGEVIRGRLPRTASGLVEEWRRLHIDELVANWERAREPAALFGIEPLQ